MSRLSDAFTPRWACSRVRRSTPAAATARDAAEDARILRARAAATFGATPELIAEIRAQAASAGSTSSSRRRRSRTRRS